MEPFFCIITVQGNCGGKAVALTRTESIYIIDPQHAYGVMLTAARCTWNEQFSENMKNEDFAVLHFSMHPMGS